MTKINRFLFNIASSDLVKSKDFYTSLLDLQVAFDSGWFIQLRTNDHRIELGIIDRNSELIPSEFQKSPTGFYITFVVENVDQVFLKAQKFDYEIISPPHETFYGQKRMLLKDPDGALLDISSLSENFDSTVS